MVYIMGTNIRRPCIHFKLQRGHRCRLMMVGYVGIVRAGGLASSGGHDLDIYLEPSAESFSRSDERLHTDL